MPEWDVELNVPIAQKYYTLDSIIGEQKYLSADASTNIYVIKSDTFIQRANLIDFIEVEQGFTSDNNNINPENGSNQVFLEFRSDEVDIDSAVFKEGSIVLNIRNTTSLPCTFNAETPGIKKDGKSLILSSFLLPGESKELKANLNGYSYSVPAEQKMFPRIFWKQFWIKAAATSLNDNVNNEQVSFDVNISNFYFSLVKGKFPETNAGRHTTAFAFQSSDDIKEYRDKISVKEAELKLRAIYNAQYANSFEINVDSLTIVGKRNNGQLMNLTDSTGSKFLSMSISSGERSFAFNEKNSNIKNFLSFLPDSIIIDATYKIDGNDQTGTVTNLDAVQFSTDFNTKSILSLKQTTLTDTLEVDLSQENRDKILNGKSAAINLEVENALPFDVAGKIVLMNENYQPLFTLKDISGSEYLNISAAKVSSLGERTSNSISSLKINLTAQQIELFSKAYYASIEVKVNTSGANAAEPVTVILRSTDWIKLRVNGKVNFNINDEL